MIEQQVMFDYFCTRCGAKTYEKSCPHVPTYTSWVCTTDDPAQHAKCTGGSCVCSCHLQ